MPAYLDKERKTWYVSFYYEDWTGQRKLKKKRGFAKKGDALAYEREFKLKEQQSSDMFFKSLVELYCDDIEGRLKPSTMDTKQNIIDTKILPYFGSQSINKIQATHVRKWQKELMGGEFSQTYLKTIHNQLSAIFNYACQYYKLPENSCRTAGSMGRKKADEMNI